MAPFLFLKDDARAADVAQKPGGNGILRRMKIDELERAVRSEEGLATRANALHFFALRSLNRWSQKSIKQKALGIAAVRLPLL